MPHTVANSQKPWNTFNLHVNSRKDGVSKEPVVVPNKPLRVSENIAQFHEQGSPQWIGYNDGHPKHSSNNRNMRNPKQCILQDESSKTCKIRPLNKETS
jgi:hypothetical protein